MTDHIAFPIYAPKLSHEPWMSDGLCTQTDPETIGHRRDHLNLLRQARKNAA